MLCEIIFNMLSKLFRILESLIILNHLNLQLMGCHLHLQTGMSESWLRHMLQMPKSANVRSKQK